MNPKYHLLVAVAALSLGACSTDNTDTEPGPKPQKGYKISFTVAEDPESRTTLDAKDILRWVYTDKVGIYTVGHNTNSNALTTADVNQSPVEFIGVMQNYVTKGDMFYAYYPYDAEQSTDPAAVTLSIPAEQTQTAAGVYNGQSNPLVALPVEIDWEENSYAGRISSVRFRHLGAIVELQLYSLDETLRGEKIRSVIFKANAPLAGDFPFNLTTVTETEELPIEGYESKVATTVLDEPAAIPATEDEAARVYLTIAPGEYTGKIIVETDAGRYTFNLAKAMTFKRAVIKGLPADLAKASPFVNFEDAAVRRICVEKWDTNKDGQLSYEEAAAVTDLEEAFKDNGTIASFDELQYFTGLRSIGDNAFSNCSSLASIKIPEQVTAIGASAFYFCSSLTSIELPNGVTEIGASAFNHCEKLTSINIPEGVTAIGRSAFNYCIKLTSINIPEGVTEIAYSAFADCRSLTSIDIPEGVTTIGWYAFSGCRGLTNIVIPDKVTVIGQSTFFGCTGLKSINIPKGVTAIEFGAFDGCSSLTSIELPNGVTRIEDSAFRECSSLTRIELPTGVKWIKDYAFKDCSSLTRVVCKPATPPTLGNLVFAGASSSLIIQVPAIAVDAYTTAESWSEYVSKIVAYNNGADPIYFEDQNVKQVCVAKWDTNRDGELSYSEAKAVTYLEPAFRGNKNIVSFNELQYFTGLEMIGEYAFTDCTNLTNIIIPDRVTAIGRYAFYNCESLTSIVIPEKVKEIGQYAFSECTGLKSINIPAGVTEIVKETFAFCSNLTSITIPDRVTVIGMNAFFKCEKLTSITIPEKVTEIEDYAFASCDNMKIIYCKPVTPPFLGRNAFPLALSSMKIYVPTNSVNTYKTDQKWGGYSTKIYGYNFN